MKEDTLMLCTALKRFSKYAVVLGGDYKMWRILIKQLIQSQIPVLDGFSLHYGLEKGGKE